MTCQLAAPLTTISDRFADMWCVKLQTLVSRQSCVKSQHTMYLVPSTAMPDQHVRFIKLTNLCTVPRPVTRLHVATFVCNIVLHLVPKPVIRLHNVSSAVTLSWGLGQARLRRGMMRTVAGGTGYVLQLTSQAVQGPILDMQLGLQLNTSTR